MRARGVRWAAALVFAGALMSGPLSAGDAAEDAYRQEIAKYRQGREARLRGQRGWLTVIGLYWLEDGVHRLGSAADAEIALPATVAPAQAGTLTVHDGRVRVQLASGVAATVDGKPARDGDLRADNPGPPSTLALGTVTLQVIQRAGRLGIRLRDSASPARRAFTGLRFFPIGPQYRVTARFVPHAQPVAITVPSAVGPAQTLQSPGAVVFTIDGRELRLDALVEDDPPTELFFVFRDQTSGHETYGGGRFLYTDMPRDGKVVLDFNRAFSPPCAFTPFATCPLPPPQNRLPIAIPAGELAPAAHP